MQNLTLKQIEQQGTEKDILEYEIDTHNIPNENNPVMHDRINLFQPSIGYNNKEFVDPEIRKDGYKTIMDQQLSWIAHWSEYQNIKLKARVQIPVQDRIFLFQFYVENIFGSLRCHLQTYFEVGLMIEANAFKNSSQVNAVINNV